MPSKDKLNSTEEGLQHQHQNIKGADRPTEEDYQLFDDSKLMNPTGEDQVYIVKQRRGYLSILFSLAQTAILICMMVQCGIAPLNINPMVGPYPDALSYWGGKNSYLILYAGEWWRTISPIMLHAGILHLFCNVSVQLDTGAFFEREWGSVIWLIIYIGSAIGGSLLSVVVSPNSIGVGSSGSVCGLFGAKLAEAFCRCCESQKSEYAKFSHSVLMEHFASTMCSVILILVFSFIPYVDWAAHVGGLLSGFSFGLMCFALRIKTMRWRLVWFLTGFVMTSILFAITIAYIFQNVKNDVAKDLEDVCEYYERYFGDYECNCQLEKDN